MKLRVIIFVAVVLLIAREACAQSTIPVASQPTTRTDFGPDVVLLDQLAALYKPVPFSHRRHAEMSQMWSGCVTCHHRAPTSASLPAEIASFASSIVNSQDGSAQIPSCKTCHAIQPDRVSLRQPSLKAAYHRQCLNCHREWAGENQCDSCHEPANGTAVAAAPQPDDIIGRMHPPIPEPDVKLFRIRVAPVAGPNVFFRHREHVEEFGIQCSSCHRRDNCSDCHASTGNGNGKHGPRPLALGRSWRDSHLPCVNCHHEDECTTCHYRDDQPAPPAFAHARLGQSLDDDHAALKCADCHDARFTRGSLTCGDASCHSEKVIEFPAQRPGTFISTAVAAPTTQRAMPATRPTVIRIRRGGS